MRKLALLLCLLLLLPGCAAREKPDADCTLAVAADLHYISPALTDNGAAFDPTATAPADITLAVDERPIGGLGIFLVRQLMDSINYERIDGKNVLTLRKEIPKELIVDNQQASE